MSRRTARIVAIGLTVLLAVTTFAVALGGRDATDPTVTDSPTAATTATPGTPDPAAAPSGAADCVEPGREPSPPAPVETGYCSRPPTIIDQAATYRATIATTEGEVVVRLADDTAPVAVNNFVYLARDGYYRDVPFHRVIEGFVVQGGDPTGTGTGCLDADCTARLPGYTFPDELSGAEQLVSEHGGYPRGAVAMANAGPNTNGSQFFIVQGSVVDLAPRYTLLGEVAAGMDVVDAIAAGPNGDRITTSPVRIRDVTVRADGGTAPASTPTSTPPTSTPPATTSDQPTDER